MSDPFLGETRLWANTYAPRNWLACEGQTLKISEYAAHSACGTENAVEIRNLEPYYAMRYGIRYDGAFPVPA